MHSSEQDSRQQRMKLLLSQLPQPSVLSTSPLQTQLDRYLALTKEGKSPNTTLHETRDYKNPYTHEKIVAYYGILEHGSNYPAEVFEAGTAVQAEEYYEAIAAKQLRASRRPGK